MVTGRKVTKMNKILGVSLDQPRMGRPTFYGETMRNVVLRMTDGQNRWLINEAKKRGISKAQLVRDLVASEQKQEEGQGISDAQFLRDLIDAARELDKGRANR